MYANALVILSPNVFCECPSRSACLPVSLSLYLSISLSLSLCPCLHAVHSCEKRQASSQNPQRTVANVFFRIFFVWFVLACFSFVFVWFAFVVAQQVSSSALSLRFQARRATVEPPSWPTCSQRNPPPPLSLCLCTFIVVSGGVEVLLHSCLLLSLPYRRCVCVCVCLHVCGSTCSIVVP